MDWISGVKESCSVLQVAEWAGLDRRLKAVGPCPVCRATQRGSSDARHPLGCAADAWECYACGAKGDAVALAAHAVVGSAPDALDGAAWDRLRAWFVERGAFRDDGETGGRRVVNRSAARSSALAAASGARRPAPAPADGVSLAKSHSKAGGRSSRRASADAIDTDAVDAVDAPSGRLYSWRDGLTDQCAGALWSGSGAAMLALAYLCEVRALPEQVLRDFGVGLYVDSAGEPVMVDGSVVVVIPLRDQHGRAVNAKFRRVPKPDSCECASPLGCKKCRVYRAAQGRPLPLFGSDRLSGDRSVPVIVVEGEFDVMAMAAYGFGANVVSSTAGAGTFTDEWLDLLEPYELIVGLYDDDKAGREGWAELVGKLGAFRCSTAVPPDKDVGECWRKGIPADAIDRAIGRARPGHGIEMRLVSEYAEEIELLIERPDALRGAPTSWALLDEQIGGWRPGITIVSGETGEGKTTWADMAALAMARAGEPVMVTSFENRIGDQIVPKLLRNELGGDFTRVSAETRRAAMDALSELPLWILHQQGRIPAPRVIEAISYARRRYGVHYFVVDHFHYLLDPEDSDRTQAIEDTMSALAELCDRDDMRLKLWLVVHPHNTPKDPRTGRARRPSMHDLKGGSSFRQYATEVVIVEKHLPSKERPWPCTDLHVEKVRDEFGAPGVVRLAYDPGSCTYADSWEETPAGRDGLMVPGRRR